MPLAVSSRNALILLLFAVPVSTLGIGLTKSDPPVRHAFWLLTFARAFSETGRVAPTLQSLGPNAAGTGQFVNRYTSVDYVIRTVFAIVISSLCTNYGPRTN